MTQKKFAWSFIAFALSLPLGSFSLQAKDPDPPRAEHRPSIEEESDTRQDENDDRPEREEDGLQWARKLKLDPRHRDPIRRALFAMEHFSPGQAEKIRPVLDLLRESSAQRELLLNDNAALRVILSYTGDLSHELHLTTIRLLLEAHTAVPSVPAHRLRANRIARIETPSGPRTVLMSPFVQGRDLSQTDEPGLVSILQADLLNLEVSDKVKPALVEWCFTHYGYRHFELWYAALGWIRKHRNQAEAERVYQRILTRGPSMPRIVVEAAKDLREWSTPGVGRSFELAFQSRSEAVRAAALEALEKHKHPQIFFTLKDRRGEHFLTSQIERTQAEKLFLRLLSVPELGQTTALSLNGWTGDNIGRVFELALDVSTPGVREAALESIKHYEHPLLLATVKNSRGKNFLASVLDYPEAQVLFREVVAQVDDLSELPTELTEAAWSIPALRGVMANATRPAHRATVARRALGPCDQKLNPKKGRRAET